MNPWPDLRPILKGIDWAIVDGVATRAYMPERMTKDLWILLFIKKMGRMWSNDLNRRGIALFRDWQCLDI